MQPVMFMGALHSDHRGNLRHNNGFDASKVKRIYTLENANVDFVRGWQGHLIEQRWFACMCGTFEVRLIAIDNWENPNPGLKQHIYLLESETLDVLWVPSGYVSSIQARSEGSILLVMADYALGELNDEYRFDSNYFDKGK